MTTAAAPDNQDQTDLATRATPDAAFYQVDLRPPVTAQAVRQNAVALRDLITQEADAIEEGARLTKPAADALRQAGLFAMSFSADRGGLEMTLEQQVEIVAHLSSIDASAGWNVAILNAGGYYASRLPIAAYTGLYPTTDRPTAGSFHPRGRAVQVDDGYLVTGNWDWGSGSYIADHVVGGCLVFDAAGEPVPGSGGEQLHLGTWLPPGAIEPLHNWQTLGIRGSGSTSFRVTEPVFVPATHTFDREAPPDPDADPLNKHVTACHFALGGVVLGIARHAVDLAGAAVRSKAGNPRATGNIGANSAVLQSLGAAMGEVDFAYSGVREIARLTDEVLFTPGRVLTDFQEARMTAANAVAANALRRILPLCVELVGAGYVMDDHPMQRVLRDGYTALAHVGTRPINLGLHAAAALPDGDVAAGGFTVPGDPVDGGFRTWLD